MTQHARNWLSAFNIQRIPTISCLPGPEISKIHHQHLFFSKTRDNHARLDEQIEHLNSIPKTGIRVWICTIPDGQFQRNGRYNVHQNINFQNLSGHHILELITLLFIFSVATLCLSMCNIPDYQFASNAKIIPRKSEKSLSKLDFILRPDRVQYCLIPPFPIHIIRHT